MHSLRLLLTSRARSLGGAGDLSNDDFLLDYGFLPPYPNTHDTCDLAWADGGLLSSARGAAGMDDSLAEWQRSALRLHIPQGYQAVSIHRAGVDERAMAACRIAAAPDAAALRKAAGGTKPLPGVSSEMRAMKIAAAAIAIGISGLPEKVSADGGDDVSMEDILEDPGIALACQFMDAKRQLCGDALRSTADRIKRMQDGDKKAALRGLTSKKEGAGVRKKSARSGSAASKPKAGGFGTKKG